MSAIDRTLNIRLNELRRRVEALPNEVAAWKERTRQNLSFNAYFSQVQAIDVLLTEFNTRQRKLLSDLENVSNPASFSAKCFALVEHINRAQRTWDYFRDKLELRFSPTFRGALWIADTVAWDCYRPVLELAADASIINRHELREPPLAYLSAEFSPATWVRGSRPHDGRDYELGTASLPIPVVEMPWDHLENAWEFLSLHHEVGHDLEADLNLREPLREHLRQSLVDAGVGADRIDVWLPWQGEIFADLVALQLAGPAFVDCLLHVLLLPVPIVVQYDPDVPHPTPYLRILMNAAFVRDMFPNRVEVIQHADRIAALWKDLYKSQPRFDKFQMDFPHVFRALMDTPVNELKNKTVRELIPFSPADDARIRHAAGYILTGQNAPTQLRPRHCISAARLAVTRATEQNVNLEDSLKEINARTGQLVRDNAQPGLRAGDASEPHKKFVEKFIDHLPF